MPVGRESGREQAVSNDHQDGFRRERKLVGRVMEDGGAAMTPSQFLTRLIELELDL